MAYFDEATPQTRYAQSGDVSIAFQTVGDSAVDIALVPGFPSHIALIPAEPAAPPIGPDRVRGPDSALPEPAADEDMPVSAWPVRPPHAGEGA
jgi:hypothetical protein